MRTKLFPKIKPYNEGFLKVSKIHTIHYEEVGNPKGKPVIFLHGGPGVGIIPQYRQFFDPKFYRIILLDQRGCGKSTPSFELKENTTWDLVEDLEKLKNHLGIKEWLVTGGSWGSTLAIAYAETYPKSVKGIIIRGVFLGRKEEIDWLMAKGGASEIWPDQWEKFTSILTEKEKKNIPKAYLKRLSSKNKKIREEAAEHFEGWEGTIMNLTPSKAKELGISVDRMISFAKTESHYSINNFFVDKKLGLLKDIKKIKDIPLTIVQGRYDTICPMSAAWDLHKKTPKSKLIVVATGSHSPLEEPMAREMVKAGEEFKNKY